MAEKQTALESKKELRETDLHCRRLRRATSSHITRCPFVYIVITHVLLWYLSKGGFFLCCPPQHVVFIFYHVVSFLKALQRYG